MVPGSTQNQASLDTGKIMAVLQNCQPCCTHDPSDSFGLIRTDLDYGNTVLFQQPRDVRRQSTIREDAVEPAIEGYPGIVSRHFGRQLDDGRPGNIGRVCDDYIEASRDRAAP